MCGLYTPVNNLNQKLHIINPDKCIDEFGQYESESVTHVIMMHSQVIHGASPAN
jgi:hypothetical protein